MWVKKLLISPVKKGFFAQKRPNLAQNWHFWSIWARPRRLIQCPVGGSIGGCGARAVSRKTSIYFILHNYAYYNEISFKGGKQLGLLPSMVNCTAKRGGFLFPIFYLHSGSSFPHSDSFFSGWILSMPSTS